jgi:hypothetical protein
MRTSNLDRPGSASSPKSTQFFRLFELPKELRLMIYECICIITRHQTMRDPTTPYSGITLTTKSLPVAILATCHFVLAECYTFMSRQMEESAEEPLRFIVDSPSFETFSAPGAAELIKQSMEAINTHSLAASFDVKLTRNRIYHAIFSIVQGSSYREGLLHHLDPVHHGIPVLPVAEHTVLIAFIQRCARYLHFRNPKFIIVAVRGHASPLPHHIDNWPFSPIVVEPFDEDVVV